MKRLLSFGVLALSYFCSTNFVPPQALANAGMIDGTVTDPSGAVVPTEFV
jgi:hypothetical protein